MSLAQLLPFSSLPYLLTSDGTTTTKIGGATGLWTLANISYAGMRAQAHPSRGWRIIAFIAGLPGTLVTYFAVKEGSCRAYGVVLPKPPRDAEAKRDDAA